MKISQKAEYALNATLDLALFAPPNGAVRSAQLARRTGVPEKFLEAILLELRKAGVVASKRGPDGGHWLARDPSRLTVGAVLDAIDGPFEADMKTGGRRQTPAQRALQQMWSQVTRAVRLVIDDVTIEDLRRQATNTTAVVDYCI